MTTEGLDPERGHHQPGLSCQCKTGRLDAHHVNPITTRAQLGDAKSSSILNEELGTRPAG